MPTTTDFWVGDRVVRPSLGEIRLGPERVRIEPRSMEVLLALAGRANEVIPKQQLIEAVWGEAFVSDEVLTHAIWDLRRAFGDNASDPEFIQTIPKRGYRLIAPVRAVDDVEKGDTDGSRSRPAMVPILLGLLLIAALAGVALWIGRSITEAPAAVPARPDEVLLLIPTDAPPGYESWGPRLDRRLLDGLTDLEGTAVRLAAACEGDPAARQTYCLEPILLSLTDAGELSASVREAGSERELFASPVSVLVDGDDVDDAARQLSGIIGAYFDVVRDPWSHDPDLEPWFNLRRHDPRAIRDFLLGVRYVYRHDVGGRDAMAVAMERDAEFIAPRVWRAPTIAAEGDGSARAAHRAELERLYAAGDAFERSMIKWAQAVLDGDPARQLRHLQIALENEPGNRAVLNARGLAHLQLGRLDRAWQDFARLLETRWNFPGLYPLAAYCAALRGEIGDLRAALEPVLELQVVDLNSLVLLRQLAIYDGDAEAEAALLTRLEARRREQAGALDPELVGLVAEVLAARAEEQGRRQIAGRLRESAD